MRHLLSGLVSWMKHVSVGHTADAERDELKRWAQTEYGKDWVFAYNYMLTHKGRAPTYGEFA